MRRYFRNVSIAAALIATAVVAFSAPCRAEKERGVGIIAEGLGIIKDADAGRARETAIEDALGMALDEYLAGKGGEGFVYRTLMALRIRSKGKEKIDSFELIDEARYDTVYWVKVKAFFKEGAVIRHDLDMIRVLVETDERTGQGTESPSASLCKTGISESLSDGGLKVVEAHEPLMKLWEERPDEGSKGPAPEADLIVLVKAQSKEKGEYGGFTAFETDADVKVIKPGSGEVVAATRISATGERSQDKAAALDSSLLKCGKEVGGYVIDKVVQNADSIASYRVMIRGVRKRGWADKVVDALSEEEGIRKVSSRFESSELTLLDVQLDKDVMEKLPYYLEHLKTVNLKVVRESYRLIEAQTR